MSVADFKKSAEFMSLVDEVSGVIQKFHSVNKEKEDLTKISVVDLKKSAEFTGLVDEVSEEIQKFESANNNKKIT